MNALTCWQTIAARIVPGHQVASGLNGNPRFPGGTLSMQTPFFRALGFDLGKYHGGTVNISIAPLRYCVIKAPTTFRQVKWHPTEPAEDFSFFDVQLIRPDSPPIAGKIYFPHPDTKPAHFQQPDVLELLLPFVKDLKYGDEIKLSVPTDQMSFEPAD
ncbi:MAG: hypothetical protein JWM16_449 [Verrucomicrobiales bacterium]|nr:hypothetical protein [Verrucomicrobiales bacterium]